MYRQPLVLSKGNTKKAEAAQRNNITVARIIAEMLKSSLGPKGMDKMLVDFMGDLTVTCDGYTILKNMEIKHPTAKLLAEVSETVNKEVGDGTSSAVIFTGKLLENAGRLLDRGVHPNVIVNGYRIAATKTLENYNEISRTISPTDRVMLKRTLMASMTSHLIRNEKDYLSDLIVEAVLKVMDETSNGYDLDLDNINIQKKIGGTLFETKLIRGVAIEREIVNSEMPKKIGDAKIALLNFPIEVKKTKTDLEIRITNPKQIELFREEERRMRKEMIDKIVSTGANVLINQANIDDVSQQFLIANGMIAMRNVLRSNIERAAKATGGRIVADLRDLKKTDLGSAESVEEEEISKKKIGVVDIGKWVFIDGCKNPKAVTILVKANVETVANEAERSIRNALSVARSLVRKPRIVTGGGASDMEVACRLRKWAGQVTDRRQLAVSAFAEALTAIPETLSTNAGLNAMDVLVELRSLHEKGEIHRGVDVLKGKVADMAVIDIYDPLVVKEQIVKSASETAILILKIDDVITSSARAAKTSKDEDTKRQE